MKRHQIMSPTCRALDITNAAPGVLLETVTKEDSTNSIKQANQVNEDRQLDNMERVLQRTLSRKSKCLEGTEG